MIQQSKTFLVGFGFAVVGDQAHGSEAESGDFKVILTEFSDWKLRCHCDKMLML